MNLDGINPRPRKRGSQQPHAPSSADRTSDEQAEEAEKEAEVDEKVGYKNPPKQHRFKKGVSGNPKGKPKGTKSFRTLFDRALDAKIVVTEGGRQRKQSKREVAAIRAANRAVEGDHKTLDLLLRHDRSDALAGTVASTPLADVPLTSGEHSILDHFMTAAREAVQREQTESPEP